MTKNEFISNLSCELKKNHISDTTDIIKEYEQHFTFKTADGFTEEEISAKLGDPSVLAVLSAIGCIYFAVFIRQMMRAYGRFHHNALASASGSAVLPPLFIHLQLSSKTNRRMRSAVLFAAAIFASCFVLGCIVSMIVSGSFEFWHTWAWFVK